MDTPNSKIAVIGMACRFPGAKNLDEYWNNLILGKDTIKHFSDDELAEFEFDFKKIRSNPDYVKARGILDDIDKFDAGFFGMIPKEAADTDPQHRIWLETVWQAFEHSNCDPFNYQGAIGVFAGGYISTYLLNILRDQKKFENYVRLRSAESYHMLTSNEPSFIASKTAYKFNLKGPAIYVQTACSTSLVAVVQACQSLYSYESDMCVAGGVCIPVPHISGYFYQEGAIPSPDGYCRPFDAQASGTVPSSGVGVVILKRMEDAIRDGDTIYAVVSGWALNNDGSNKVSYTAPSIDGQAEVIMLAQSFAEISPEDISYIEAHGTATKLGDPVEIAALTKAFSSKTNKKQFCGIGSVKSNIGHTDAAAGVASFIKTCLSAYYKKIPPSLHFSEPNPHIDFSNSPFFVQKELREWNDTKPLIMGVSSFGIGGTNAHVIVEEAPVKKPAVYPEPYWPELIILSARSEYSLKKRKNDLLNFIKNKPDINIHDVAYTLWTGRNHMPYRSYLVASHLEEIISGVDNFTDGKTEELISKIAFMFPGQGAQYVGMGKNLYHSDHLFRQILDECFEVYKSETGEDLKSLLFESPNTEESDAHLASTDLTQPALFIIEYAMAKIFMGFEIIPSYLIGHSIGEYVAACIAGVFDMTTALKIVIKRGQLMKSMPAGKMMAVKTSIDQLKSIDNSSFEIAADNSSAFCTVSFKPENTDKVIAVLNENKIDHIPLNTSHAFHSADFDPILQEFADYVDQFNLATPKLACISCLTGEFITPEQATSGKYWANQLRNTVMFRKGITSIIKNDDVIFLEVGPNTHLSSLVKQNKEVTNKKAIITTLGKADDTEDRYKVMNVLGNLFNIGININPETIYKDFKPGKISLPTYPFERKRYWIEFRLPAALDSQKDAPASTIQPDSVETDFSGEYSDIDIPDSRIKINKKILKIWKSVFGIEEIGPDDDFFELGGHSLSALQILGRIKEELNQNIPLKTFLENPTINKLSPYVKEKILPQETSEEVVRKKSLKNIPLSFNQKRIWIISQLEGSNPAYNIPYTYHFTGDLNIEAFRKSINKLFDRHFVMFSVFKQKDGEPYFDIIPGSVNIELIDFSDESIERSRERIYSFASEDSRKPFKIESDPLYRLYLLRQDDSNWYFQVTIHHLIFDAWSGSIFLYELKKIYESIVLNKELELEDVSPYYFNYFNRLHIPDNKLDEERSTKFWTEHLMDCPSQLNFPYDFPRKEYQSGFGEKEDITISSECTHKLREISKKENATLFATVLSAMGVLFQKYSGDNDFCIGTHVANRPQPSFEKIFGILVNTLPIRLKIDVTIKFTDLISDTKTVLLDAIFHQELPFEKIVEAVNPPRYTSMNPLFQVSIVWIYHSAMPIDLPGAKGEHINIKKGISPFDITFYLWEKDDYIIGEIEYNTDILNRDTIIRLKDNFIQLLLSLVDNPDQNISEISIISENERMMLDKFNRTEVTIPDCLVQNFFEEYSVNNPSKTAIISGNSALTFSELDNHANQLAGHLLSLGVTTGDIIGVCMERSVEMVVSLLGVLKAGCCYLPLDPSFPDDRINYMIEDSDARILISQDSLKEKFHQSNNTQIVLIDIDNDKIKRNSSVKPDLTINNQSPVYMIYTSGSTGKPKGVKVPHYAVVNLTESMSKVPGIKESDILLAVVTLSFDMSVFEIFLPLSRGATIVVASTRDTTDGPTIMNLIEKNNISVIQATPSFWNILLSSEWQGKKNLKALCGGEALTSSLVRQILPKVGEFWNCYGPTETTVYATCSQITDPEAPIIIGKPIYNTSIFILDKNKHQLPIGVIGEVCIGGLGVVEGYYNRLELTNEKFIQFNGKGVYKTGDLGRFLPDGNIELYGRLDDQIKLRGFRIEPGEIENLLTTLPNVIEAVVKIHSFDENDERLVAFLNTGSDFNLTKEEISESLSKLLPPYMIPFFYKISEGFPRLPNGKINKKALVFEPGEIELRHVADFDSLTSTQKKILKIWKAVLKIQNINPSDDFFNIGGNSLLAIKIINLIREELGVKLSFRSLINYPTIIQLGNYIANQTQKSEKSIELVHLTETTNLPLSANQKRLWLITKLQPEIPSYIIPVTYHITGPLNKNLFESSIGILFSRHHLLFSTIKEIDGKPFLNIIPEEVHIEFIDNSSIEENKKSQMITDFIDEESIKIFDLEKGPLYRLFLIKTGTNEYYFHMSIHHIIFDGWSIPVLINDLAEIYSGLLNNKEINLENLEFQQYDYAYWEQQNGTNIYKKETSEFWKNYLKDISPVLNFPYDFSRKISPSGRGGRERLQLTEKISKKLREISKNANSSLFATMLSTYAILLQKYTGEDDICIGTPVAYRPHSKLEKIVGMFVNTVVLRIKFERGEIFKNIIRSTNETLLNTLAHQDLPFEDIVDIVKPERSSNINPIFQVSFVWQNNLNIPIKLNGIRGELVSGKNGTSVFDLTIYMWENENIIEGEIEFSTDLLKRDTILKLRDHYLALIKKFVENIDVSIDSVAIISEEEKKKVISFNDTITPYPKDKTIVQLFEEQVNLYPQKMALVFKDKKLTYRQLNEKTNQLAHTLRNLGVKNDVPVGLLTEKSSDMIIGILGILKAGGMYVPIDPEYPEQRISFMIRDAGCKVLLTQKQLMEVGVDGVTKIDLNFTDSYHRNKSNVENINRPSDLAYIMYTSGTTGIPKGSLIQQLSVIRLVRNTNYIELSPDDRILLTGAIVFDASTFEIWGALLNGGTLYIVDKDTILNPKALGKELLNNDITILWLTSPLFTQIAETRTDIFSKLKYLLVGGDVLSPRHINKVQKDNPQLKVINGYGPTENTTFSTTYLIEKDFENNIPIGKPISNSTAYIFDTHLNYQPIGIIGELYLGGDGLSRGYLNREDLNKKSFIDHPNNPGERLYKTGDRARWLADGNIEFYGRFDNQLKIRGYRVELEEIESAISEIEGVIETVVKPYKIKEGDTRLIAFLNVPCTFKMDVRGISMRIKDKLPPYMIPSYFKLLNGFPKTTSGKIDRKALSFDINELDSKGREELKDLSHTEKIILDIWCDALKTKDILLTDNFFDIGGNSLLAISVFSKIESAFNVELNLRVFFDSPRIKDLADIVDVLQHKSDQPKHVSDKSKSDSEIIEGEI